MNYWQRRKTHKAVHHLLHEARHARNMREDIASPDKLNALHAAEEKLKRAWDDEAGMEELNRTAEELHAAANAVYPPHRKPRLRENIEIIVVALAVAMAFRTFFIQPFRIPTGSMQPTLYGITYIDQQERGVMDHFPLSIVSFLLTGERYVEVRAKADGLVDFQEEYTEDAYVLRIAGIPHLVPRDMPRRVDVRRSTVHKGDLIASGRKKLGDHIFVNRISYNFSKPHRGDIFVFSTRDIKHPDIRPDNYYIKRLVGLPGDRISIDPPWLVANGERVIEPNVFMRQAQDVLDGYHGYTLVGNSPIPALLRTAKDSIQLGDGEYLPFGDNTRSSLDGRFFGAVDQESIIGPAFMIYWPFTKRWGLVH